MNNFENKNYNLIIMSEFSEKLNKIIGIIVTFAILFFLRYIVITINVYNYPESISCIDLKQILPNITHYTLNNDFYFSWHNDVKLSSTNLNIRSKCPSINLDSQLIVNNKFIASTSEQFFSQNYTINDCHNMPLFIVNKKIQKKHEVFQKEHKLVAEVLSPDGQDFIAYIANVNIIDKSFDIFDINKKYVAKIRKHFYSLSWYVEIIDTSHNAADPRLIMLIIGKISSGYIYDFCNTFVGGVTTLFIFSLLVGPFFIIYLLYVMYCEKKNVGPKHINESLLKNY